MFQSIVESIMHFAETTPDKLCLADDNSNATYREYSEIIRKYAAFFVESGIKKNDRVVVEANQTIDYLAIQSALQLIGAIFVPVEHNCAAEKIASFIDRVHAAAVIVNKDEDKFEGMSAYSYACLKEKTADMPPFIATEMPRAGDISEILFSTGTTGREKGIILTHGNNVALAENVLFGVDMKKDNVEMIPSPMNHSHGLRRYYANMYNGSTVILLGSAMDMPRFFGNITRYNVNSMDLVPSALAVVLKLSKNKLADYSDQLRYIQYGSAPLMQKDVETVCGLLPKTRMYNIYGSTESGCSCIYEFNRADAKKGCIGKPTRNTTVLIVDDDRNPIESSPEKTGCVATQGGMNMLGYWEDEAETARAMKDGIVYSSDIGYVDADSDIILLGRKGDVINVGGNKVSPEEIENAAKKMSAIADCGCVSAPDKAKGQVPKLFVQMTPGAEFDVKKIRSFLMAQLEPYKVPVYIEQIEKIPRTFNGKILRKELR